LKIHSVKGIAVKITITFEVDASDCDGKSDLDAAVAHEIRCIDARIDEQSMDGLPEYTFE
jgi:hypothetical protein